MEANQRRTRWTYAEFARLPTSGSTRYEVIDGELVVTPAPSGTHQRIVGDLVVTLGSFVKDHSLGRIYPGPLDVLFAEGDYMEPDLLFVRSDRAHLVSDRGVEGPPDLIVEVGSPSTAARDRSVKLDRYRYFGVGEYWIVDPERRTIEVWRLGEGAAEAEVFGAENRLEWRPIAGGPTLELDVGELFGED
jgi:Uma2 family endonuclease